LLDTYSEAKRQLSNFCETSTTEIEEEIIYKPRKRVPKRNYDSFSDNENDFFTRPKKTQNQGTALS